MKVKRFLAASAKAALAQVKERLGADAVILSNRTTADGVEVLAIAEVDMARVATPDEAALEAAAPPDGFAASFRRPTPDAEAQREDITDRTGRSEANAASPRRAVDSPPSVGQQPNVAPRPFAPRAAEARPLTRFAHLLRAPQRAPERSPERPPRRSVSVPRETARPRKVTAPPPVPNAEASAGSRPTELLTEIRALRGLMEERFSTLVWSEQIRQRPVAAALMRLLLSAGYSTSLARAATNALPADLASGDMLDWLKAKIVARLQPVDATEECVERGGVYALTGPTGVGKTTTAAKIAARAAMRYGGQHLGLITTDTYRIGAHDQLRVFGKILGVPVHSVDDVLGLEQALAQLQGKRLVLIDTIGLGQRDERVAEQQAMLDACGVERLLLLSATSQLEALDDVVQAYMHGPDGSRRAGGAVITKTDESVKLGSVVDVLIRHKLPLHFLGTGQRVPEDLELPDVDRLVDQSLRVRDDGPFAPTADEIGLMAMGAALDTMFVADAHA